MVEVRFPHLREYLETIKIQYRELTTDEWEFIEKTKFPEKMPDMELSGEYFHDLLVALIAPEKGTLRGHFLCGNDNLDQRRSKNR